MRSNRILLFILFTSISICFAQDPLQKSTIHDIDGNSYTVVRIGNQWWMTSNLKVTHYANGDTIAEVNGNSEWAALSSGAYSSYNNSAAMEADYQYLYNWFAVDDSRGLAPVGYHIPTDADWQELEAYLGMSASQVALFNALRGTNEGGKLKETGTGHWQSPNTDASDDFDFTALPGGYRNESGSFAHEETGAFFWTCSSFDSARAVERSLLYNTGGIRRFAYDKRFGKSIRCVKNADVKYSNDAKFTCTPTHGCAPLSVSFSNMSSGDIENVYWDFGDGGSSSDYNPVHIYEEPGLYDVSLLVSMQFAHDSDRQPGAVLCIPHWEALNMVEIYSNNFEGPEMPSFSFRNQNRWNLIPDNQGLGIITSLYDADTSFGLGEYALIDSIVTGNFLFGFDARTTEDLKMNDYADFCLVWGYADENNYNYFMVNSAACETAAYAIIDGSRKLLQKRTGVYLLDNNYHHIGIEGRDNSILVSFNDEPVIFLQGQQWTGRVGFGSYNDMAVFDNVLLMEEATETAVPVVCFGADTTSGLAPCDIQFFDKSTGEVDTWLWEFGDGESSTERNPKHTYQYADTFTVSLTVSGPGGDSTMIREHYIIVSEQTSVVHVLRPSVCKLYPNYPNPFNPQTMICYELDDYRNVLLDIINIHGQVVCTLVNSAQSPGRYHQKWCAELSPSGIYFIRLKTGKKTFIRRMLLLK